MLRCVVNAIHARQTHPCTWHRTARNLARHGAADMASRYHSVRPSCSSPFTVKTWRDSASTFRWRCREGLVGHDETAVAALCSRQRHQACSVFSCNIRYTSSFCWFALIRMSVHNFVPGVPWSVSAQGLFWLCQSRPRRAKADPSTLSEVSEPLLLHVTALTLSLSSLRHVDAYCSQMISRGKRSIGHNVSEASGGRPGADVSTHAYQEGTQVFPPEIIVASPEMALPVDVVPGQVRMGLVRRTGVCV